MVTSPMCMIRTRMTMWLRMRLNVNLIRIRPSQRERREDRRLERRGEIRAEGGIGRLIVFLEVERK